MPYLTETSEKLIKQKKEKISVFVSCLSDKPISTVTNNYGRNFKNKRKLGTDKK